MGTGAAVGACLVFGIVTGGWGLLACGVVGGLGGGWLGAKAGERIYYSRNSNVERGPLDSGILDVSELTVDMPANMCADP